MPTDDRKSNPSEDRKPGFSRDVDLEDARDSDRPADANMDFDDRSADSKPNRDIHVSPDPDEGK